jgi:hypothetical protein
MEAHTDRHARAVPDNFVLRAKHNVAEFEKKNILIVRTLHISIGLTVLHTAADTPP